MSAPIRWLKGARSLPITHPDPCLFEPVKVAAMNEIAPFDISETRRSEEHRAEAVSALEDGSVVLMEELPFAFTPEEEALYGASLGDGVQKNITLTAVFN